MDVNSIRKELQFKAIRSSGAGGQHVNKVSSKVALSFDILNSLGLSNDEKALLIKNLESKLTKDQRLILFCEETRSQFRNRELATKRLFKILEDGLQIAKTRKATKPTKASIKKRLATKKKHSEKKSTRKKPDID